MNILLDPLSFFHKILESVVLIDRLHVGLREEVLLGAAPSRHARGDNPDPYTPKYMERGSAVFY
jgi:hypothetical protein